MLLPCGKYNLFLSHGKYLEHKPTPNSKLTTISQLAIIKSVSKRKIRYFKRKKSKLLKSNASNDSLSEIEYSNDCFSESGLLNNDDIDDLNKYFKRPLIR
jgi:hypothetical protein